MKKLPKRAVGSPPISGQRSLLLVFLLVSFIAFGSVPQTANLPNNPKIIGPPLVETPGRPGGELSSAATAIPDSLNPYVEPFSDIVDLMHATLLELNPVTLEIEPALAESFVISEDHTQITLTLREGVRWSDGVPFTTDDVLFTLVDVLQNEELLESLREAGVNVSPPPPFRVVKLDEHTLIIELEFPIADRVLADLAQFVSILPRHKLADTVRSLNPNAATDAFVQAWGLNTPPDQIAGLGPFRLREVKKTGIPFISERIEAIVLERNPFYWKVDLAGTQLPYVDRFRQVFVRDDEEALEALTRGEIDLLSVGLPEVAELGGAAGVELVVDGPELSVTFLSFNQDVGDPDLKGLFRDVRFRQAVAHVIDRASLVRGVPEAEPFLSARESFVHPLSPFFSEEATFTFETDFAKAEALLGEIGLQDMNGDGILEFPSGRPVAFELITNDDNPVRVAGGSILAEGLSQIGIRVDFRPVPFGDLVRLLDLEGRRPGYQAVIVRFRTFGSLLSPDYLRCLFHSQGGCHIQRFSDAQGQDLPAAQRRIDEIFEAWESPDTGPQERVQLLRELQEVLSQDLSLIPLWSERITTAVKPDVQNTQKINVLGLESFIEVLWRE